MLEISICAALMALIGALALISFYNSRTVRDLVTSGQNTVSVLQTARTNASAGQDASPWGVHLDLWRITLFRGSAYAGASASTSYPLPSSIEIADIALAGGGQDIVFKRITGATDQSGTFLVRVRGSASQTFSISVDASGEAYQTRTSPAQAGTRIIDARHRAFVLAWSIQNAATLTLNFNDSESVQTIAMAPYFNAEKNVFDWSGIIMVEGQNQTLRVHTASLSGTATVLHVDRDCRRNTKIMNNAVDGKDIATYLADCKTVTVGAFGGVMSEP